MLAFSIALVRLILLSNPLRSFEHLAAEIDAPLSQVSIWGTDRCGPHFDIYLCAKYVISTRESSSLFLFPHVLLSSLFLLLFFLVLKILNVAVHLVAWHGRARFVLHLFFSSSFFAFFYAFYICMFILSRVFLFVCAYA